MEDAGYGDKNIVVWDHNRDLLTDRANVILDDPEAYKYVWGVGYHWYETWAGGDSMHDNLAAVKESYPEIELLFTEGTVEGFREDRYQHWPNAERYARSMIKDFNIGTVGWTDWNLLLDHTGGPNHVSNFCFAPIHANSQTDQLIYTPTYFYIGHFSKFITQGAHRISTTTSRSDLESTSFKNENGSIVTVVMNATDHDINYKLVVKHSETILNIGPHSIQSIIH